MSIEDSTTAIRDVWEIVNAEFGRVLAPLLVVQDSRLALGSDHYAVYLGGDREDARALEFWANAGNQTLIFCGITGAQAGRTIRCLYRLTGARLPICNGLDGKWPSELKPQSHPAHFVTAFRRREPYKPISLQAKTAHSSFESDHHTRGRKANMS